MKNKGFVISVTISLIVFSLYQLSFTWRANSIETEAKEISTEQGTSFSSYIDSIRGEVAYNLGIFKFNYAEVKQRALNLGLDLQGGMNVTLEVSAPDIIKALAGSQGTSKLALDFSAALEEAEKEYKGSGDFINLFFEKFIKKSPSGKLAPIFATLQNKEQIKSTSTNEEVLEYLRKVLSDKVDNTYNVLSARIDKFGVAQPNVQQLDGGRILVELPGVDNPQRVRNILQSSAELEFWYTFQNYAAYKILEAVNNQIIKIDGIQNKTKTYASDPSVNLSSGDELLKSLGVNENIDDSTTGLAVKDSLETTTDTTQKQLSAEEFAKQNPLTGKISPYIFQGENGAQWAPSAIIGSVQSKDKEKVEKLLARDDIQDQIPNNVRFAWSFKPQITDKGLEFYYLYALKGSRNNEPALSGDVVQSARPSTNPNGEVGVSMTMNRDGANEWKIITSKASKKSPKECVAIVLDGQVYSAPTVQGEIPNGRSEISGNFTQNEAQDLANILETGKLPAKAQIVEETVVGPSLGKSAINAGISSLFIGFILVISFMILYYNTAGVYSVLALLLNLLLIISILAGYGAALTLPGMAGLVLTIGMAVDANVLIFERIKEEILGGKTLKAAIKAGYKEAQSSIFDANVTTIIVAIILGVFGKGPVFGFAIILGIGICCSLFTSMLVTRMLIEWHFNRKGTIKFDTSISKNLFKKPNFQFIKSRRVFYITSSVIILVGVVSLFTKGLSSGVDFKGGWSYIVQLDQPVNTVDLKSEIGKYIKDNTEVKTYGMNNQYKITTAYRINDKGETLSDEVKGTVIKALAKYNGSEKSILSESKVGPTIANDTRNASTMAIILSLVGMFAYIVLRFRKVGFGLGATAALFHDVLIVFSIYSILKGIVPFPLDIDQAFIAAILTVVGYSINDTVVVFDRVREFLGLHKHEKQTGVVINNSINATLSRTVVTSFTTLLVVLILFLFGGEGLKGFTFALLIGILVGTYSSVGIATPVVVDIEGEERKAKK